MDMTKLYFQSIHRHLSELPKRDSLQSNVASAEQMTKSYSLSFISYDWNERKGER